MTRLIFILIISLTSTICSQAQTIQYIGAPTTTVISRGNFRSDSLFYLPKRLKAPTDTAAIRYQISDSSVYVWTGSQWLKPATDTTSLSNRINLKLNISDTASMLSPYYRSATATAALATKLNISDTSTMLTPYLRKVDTTAMLSPYYRSATATAALALKLNISDTSTMLGNYVRHAGYGLTKSGQGFLVDTLNISTRAWRQKGIDSVRALISAGTIGGSGTTNYVPKFTAASTIGNSQIFDNGTNVGIGITTGMSERFNIANSSANANASISTSSAASGAWLRFGNATNADGLYVGYNNPAGTLFGGVGGANGGVIMGYGSYSMGFGTNATERLRIFANGRIGVNTTTDAGYQFDIAGNLRTTTGANFATSSGSVGIGTASPSRTLHIYRAGATTELYLESDVGTQAAYYLKNTSNALYMPAGRTGQMRLFVNAADRVTFDSTGFVGIGTTTPTYNLDVNGTLRSVNGANFATTSGNVGIGTASPNQKLTIQSGVGDVAGITMRANGLTSSDEVFIGQGSAGSLFLTNRSTNPITFQIGGFTRMNLTNDAELFVNTTSDAGDYKLQVAGNIYNTGSAVLAATSGNVGIGTASPAQKLDVNGISNFRGDIYVGVPSTTNGRAYYFNAINTGRGEIYYDGSNNVFRIESNYGGTGTYQPISFYTSATERGRINSAGEWIIDASGTDAGDYKLQVVGNARIGTGKLDIASNTTFGLGIARSGTSEVAGQIYNSNGILYTGVESSAGGQIFSGSSAYAAVIGSGANYPLQFATNNVTRATINTNGELLIGSTADAGAYALQVTGAMYTTSTITTASPTADPVRPWKLGSVQAGTVALDTANYVEVEINGTYYRLAIVTPL
jgi:hypothetical protein